MTVRSLSQSVLREGKVMLAAIAFYGLLVALPPSLWIEVRSIVVNSAPTPAEVTIKVDRSIHWPFDGIYSVTIRRVPGLQFVCTAQPPNAIRYRPGAQLPDPLSLSWWLGEPADLQRCEAQGLGPGRYLIETCYTVLRPFWGLVPSKHYCLDSPTYDIGVLVP